MPTNMKTFAFAALSALAVALPSANEARQSSGSNEYIFTVLTERSSTPVHFKSFYAAEGGLFLALPTQDATCINGADGNQAAIFSLDTTSGTLHLYTTEVDVQQLYVVRSGTDQGKIGYIFGSDAAPGDVEFAGWKVDSGYLSYEGTGFQACPLIDGSWSVRLEGYDNPGGNQDCLTFSAMTTADSDPTSCFYRPAS
jgi:hypothetical protein